VTNCVAAAARTCRRHTAEKRAPPPALYAARRLAAPAQRRAAFAVAGALAAPYRRRTTRAGTDNDAGLPPPGSHYRRRAAARTRRPFILVQAPHTAGRMLARTMRTCLPSPFRRYIVCHHGAYYSIFPALGTIPYRTVGTGISPPGRWFGAQAPLHACSSTSCAHCPAPCTHERTFIVLCWDAWNYLWLYLATVCVRRGLLTRLCGPVSSNSRCGWLAILSNDLIWCWLSAGGQF